MALERQTRRPHHVELNLVESKESTEGFEDERGWLLRGEMTESQELGLV